MRSVVAQDGTSGHRLRVGTRTWLCQAERSDQLTARAARQPLLLLLLGAEEDDALAADRLVRAEVHRQRRVCPADFAEDPVEHLG